MVFFNSFPTHKFQLLQPIFVDVGNGDRTLDQRSHLLVYILLLIRVNDGTNHTMQGNITLCSDEPFGNNSFFHLKRSE